jgi:hypothetical protein
VLYLSHLCFCGPCGADLQFLEYLSRVGIDDRDAKVLGNVQADGRLSDSSGSGYDDECFIRKL